MQQGYLSLDNFSEVFRDLSQRRRTGELCLQIGPDKESVFFGQGKVVDVSKMGQSGSQRLFERLQVAGFVGSSEQSFKSYQELFDYLTEQEESAHLFDRELFDQSVRHFLFDQLLSISLEQGARYEFKNVGMDSQVDSNCALVLSQFLLDKALVDQEMPALEREFRSNLFIRTAGKQPADLDDECSLVYSMLGDGLSVQRLLQCCLLSRFHTFLSLKKLQVLGHIETVYQSSAEDQLEDSPELIDDVQDIFDVVEQTLNDSLGIGSGQAPKIDTPTAQEQEVVSQTLQGGDKRKFRVSSAVPSRLTESSRELGRNSKMLYSERFPHLFVLGFVLTTTFMVLFRWEKVFELFFQL